MDRYIVFNVELFLKEAKKWGREKKKLTAELDSVLELTAITNSEVHSGKISDPTSNAANKRMKISTEIKRLDNYQRILEYGLSHITTEQRDLIENFYLKQGVRLNRVVDDYCNELDVSPRTVYRMKKLAVRAFESIVTSIM